MMSRFSIRAFTTTILFLSFIGLPITGTALHYASHTPTLAGQHSWMAAHNVLGLLFLSTGIWHLSVHRRALVRSLLQRKGGGVPWELTLAVAVIALFMGVAVGHSFLF